MSLGKDRYKKVQGVFEAEGGSADVDMRGKHGTYRYDKHTLA